MREASFDDIRDCLAECSDGEALLADGFEDALIGMAEGWFANARRIVALYDHAACLQVLVRSGMDEQEAGEYFDYNVTGAYVGPGTPVFAIIRRQPLIVAQDQ